MIQNLHKFEEFNAQNVRDLSLTLVIVYVVGDTVFPSRWPFPIVGRPVLFPILTGFFWIYAVLWQFHQMEGFHLFLAYNLSSMTVISLELCLQTCIAELPLVLDNFLRNSSETASESVCMCEGNAATPKSEHKEDPPHFWTIPPSQLLLYLSKTWHVACETHRYK